MIGKIISWNVNGLRAVERKGALQTFLDVHAPDLFLLQEIKGSVEQFSPYLTQNEAYAQHYHSAQKAGYAGTGIWIKRTFLEHLQNIAFDTHVPHLVNANEGRVLCLHFSYAKTSYSILSVYFPNGGKSEQAWHDKLTFYDDIRAYMNTLHARGRVVVVGGDMNVAHKPIDLAHSKENDGKICFHPEERARIDRFIADGWVDVWRALHPNEKKYSWWNMVTRARERNVGWRLDYFFLHTSFMENVTDAFIDNDIYGSDHCPVGIEYTFS